VYSSGTLTVSWGIGTTSYSASGGNHLIEFIPKGELIIDQNGMLVG